VKKLLHFFFAKINKMPCECGNRRKLPYSLFINTKLFAK
jgi:hypothetical protein